MREMLPARLTCMRDSRANAVILAGVPPGAGQCRFVRVIPVLIFPGARSCAGFVLPAKRQVIAAPGGTGPEPAVPAWAHYAVGVGPALPSPDGAPVRWLLMDGYVYHIRDDQDHPPWRETLASPMGEI